MLPDEDFRRPAVWQAAVRFSPLAPVNAFTAALRALDDPLRRAAIPIVMLSKICPVQERPGPSPPLQAFRPGPRCCPGQAPLCRCSPPRPGSPWRYTDRRPPGWPQFQGTVQQPRECKQGKGRVGSGRVWSGLLQSCRAFPASEVGGCPNPIHAHDGPPLVREGRFFGCVHKMPRLGTRYKIRLPDFNRVCPSNPALLRQWLLPAFPPSLGPALTALALRRTMDSLV